MKLAFVFPGQGSQSVGMGTQLCESYAGAKRIYEHADDIVGYGLSAVCANGPEDQLSTTKITQPAIFTTSVATLSVLTEAGIKPDVVAGHSVGEYAALVAAGAIKWDAALALVQRRAIEMDKAATANPGAMAVVLGLDSEAVLKVCKDTESAGHGIVDGANFNAETQIVISGEKDAVAAASALAQERGGKVRSLAVSGAFHSRLMTNAARAMASVIESAPIDTAPIPVVANITANYETNASEIKANLVSQIDGSVWWDKSVRKMIADGVDTFVEVGSGRILAGMLKRVSGEIKIYATSDPASIEETIIALSGVTI